MKRFLLFFILLITHSFTYAEELIQIPSERADVTIPIVYIKNNSALATLVLLPGRLAG